MAPRLALRPRRADRRSAARRAALLGVGATAAATGFGALAAASARRAAALARADAAVAARPMMAGAAPAARRALDGALVLGKWWAYLPAALGAAGYLLRARGATSRGRAGAGAVALAGATAAALSPAFDRWLPQPPMPPGRRLEPKPVFPSGHTFGPGAVALTAAYVLAREGLAPAGAALPAALALPLAFGGGKVAERKHWASDVAGGYLGALALAGACAAAYERARAR